MPDVETKYLRLVVNRRRIKDRQTIENKQKKSIFRVQYNELR